MTYISNATSNPILGFIKSVGSTTLDCTTKFLSNQSFLFHFQGLQLYNNLASGIIITNQSLVLQSVTKDRAGMYTCTGHNQEGDGESPPVQLDIKCE